MRVSWFFAAILGGFFALAATVAAGQSTSSSPALQNISGAIASPAAAPAPPASAASQIAAPVSASASASTSAPAVPASSPASSPAPRGFWKALFDNVLAITLVLIFFGAAIGAIIKTRRRDRVLKEFAGYQVTALLQDGQRVWGTLEVYPNGILLRFRAPYRNSAGHVLHSFILYQGEYGAVRALLRLDKEQSGKNRRRRREDIRHYENAGVGRRSRRWMVKQVALLRDALVNSLGVVIAQAKKIAPTTSLARNVLTSQDARLTEISGTVLGAINLANDPILERHFGRWCVVETKEEGGWREVPGILKEYSADWIELLDASWPREMEITVPADASEFRSEEASCRFVRCAESLTVVNEPPGDVELIELSTPQGAVALQGRRLGPEDSHTIEAPKGSRAEAWTLSLRLLEKTDVILPRAQALLRHTGPPERPRVSRSPNGGASGDGSASPENGGGFSSANPPKAPRP